MNTWGAQVRRDGVISIGGREFWSPELQALALNFVTVQAPKRDATELKVTGPRGQAITAQLLAETGFFDVEGAREIARDLRSRRQRRRNVVCASLEDQRKAGIPALTDREAYERKWIERATRIAQSWSAKYDIAFSPERVLELMDVPSWEQREREKARWASVIGRKVEVFAEPIEKDFDKGGLGILTFSFGTIAEHLQRVREVVRKALDVIFRNKHLGDRSGFQRGETGLNDFESTGFDGHGEAPAGDHAEKGRQPDDAGHCLSEAAK